MTETLTAGQEVQGEILNTVRKSQDAVVDAIKRWADAVQSMTPSMPMPGLPYADKLPRPEEFVASAYDFAEEACSPASGSLPSTSSMLTTPMLTAKNGTNGTPAPEDRLPGQVYE